MTADLPARRSILYRFIAGAIVATGLALLLIFGAHLSASAYRAGFFLGLTTFVMILLGPAGCWDSRMMGSIPSRRHLIFFMYVGMSPYLLLLESGIAGYRGFSSWMRYVSLMPAILGGVGLGAGFLLARLNLRGLWRLLK